MTEPYKIPVFSPYKHEKHQPHIPRHQRRCITCIYGGSVFDNNELATDREMWPHDWKIICNIQHRPTWHMPHDFCGEGRWEWVSKSGRVTVYEYKD